MDVVKPIRKSDVIRTRINQLTTNLVDVEVDITFFRNKQIVISHVDWKKNHENLMQAEQKRKDILDVIRACEQVLEVYLKEEKPEVKTA